jgi:hypothetical protein
MTASFQIISNPSFINILQFDASDTENVVKKIKENEVYSRVNPNAHLFANHNRLPITLKVLFT